jgi:photosystem II stability/assembly factor-like uncharacterized protein
MAATWCSGAWAAAPRFAALEQPAVMSPRATGAAMLAVARAGRRLVAGGERGVVLLSDDDGATWRQARTPVRTSLTALQFVDDRHGWAVGHLGVVLHSADGGASWTKQLDGLRLGPLFGRAGSDLAGPLADDGPDKPWLGVHFTDARRGLIVGAYNLAMQTNDGGATWQPMSDRLPNPKGLHLYGVQRRGASVFIVGEQGLLLRSDDGGERFTALASPYKGTWFGVVPLADDDWLAYGLRGTAHRTTDRGAHWQPLRTDAAVTLSAGLRRPDGRVLLVTQNGDVLLSDAALQRFERRGLPLGAPVADAVLAADGALVVASLRGPLRTVIEAASR